MGSGKVAEIVAQKYLESQDVVQIDAKRNKIADASNVAEGKRKGSVTDKKKPKSPKTLMSTEKTAVAAMLAMKSSSDESDADSTTTANKVEPFSQPTSSGTERPPVSLPLLASV
jgi:hypothetical protein